jgi:hypothetical protein
VAVSTLGSAALSSVGTTYLQGRQRAGERRTDADRDDLIAARVAAAAVQAEQAAALLVQRQDQTELAGRRWAEQLEKVAEHQDAQGATLEKIHGLVNSSYTSSIKADRTQTSMVLALAEESLARDRHDGLELSPLMVRRAAEATTRLVDLDALLAARAAQQAAIDAATIPAAPTYT